MATPCLYPAYPRCMWRVLPDHQSVFLSTACTEAFEIRTREQPKPASKSLWTQTHPKHAFMQLSFGNYQVRCIFHTRIVPVPICRYFLSVEPQEYFTGCDKSQLSQILQWIANGQNDFYLHVTRSHWTSQVDGQCLQLVGEDGEAPSETRYDCDFPLFFLLPPLVTWPFCWEILIWPCVCSVCLYSSPIPLRHSCPFSAFTYLPSSPRLRL